MLTLHTFTRTIVQTKENQLQRKIVPTNLQRRCITVNNYKHPILKSKLLADTKGPLCKTPKFVLPFPPIKQERVSVQGLSADGCTRKFNLIK